VLRYSGQMPPAGAASPTTTPADASSDLPRERRNYWLHVSEGAALIGAFGAINANTVGTSLVEHLSGPAWMVALMPMASAMGFSIGPIFVAHHLDRQKHFLPVLKRTVPLSRLPVLVTAFSLWWFGVGPVSLWTVVLGSVLYGVFGGLTVGAWQQLIAATVAPERRASLFATRYLVSNVLALGSAALVAVVLAHWPGTKGYAVLHLMAFAGAMVSFKLLMKVEEPPRFSLPPPERAGFFANLSDVPGLFLRDRRLGYYLASSILFNSQFLLMGFLAVWAKNVLAESEAYVGTLTGAQMVGAVLGTLVAAFWGNRYGCRTLLIASRVLLVAVAVGAVFAHTDWAFRLIFAGYGAAGWVNLTGHNTMTLQLLPRAKRSTVLAVFSLVQVPSMLVAAQLGAWLWHHGTGFHWIAGASALGFIGALLTMLPVRVES
jgi:MFS family permease